MPHLLWISPFSLHDRANTAARQLMCMIQAVKLMQPQLEIYVLSPTIFSDKDPMLIEPRIRAQLTQAQGNILVSDQGINFLYLKTINSDFGSMVASEQRNFVNELVPLFHTIKPDVVVVHSSDLLSLCALNQAKACGLATAFILNDFQPNYFHFADVDLVFSTAYELTKAFVPNNQPPVVSLGPFVPVSGPLNQSVLDAKRQGLLDEDKAKDGAAAATATAGNGVSNDDGTGNSNSNGNGNGNDNGDGHAVAAEKTVKDRDRELKNHISAALDKLVPFAQRRKILLVNPTIENGLSLFLYTYAHRHERPELQNAEFVIIEQQRGQFAKNLKLYQTSPEDNRPAFAQLDLKDLKVLPPQDDAAKQLEKELRDCQVFMMPSLAAAVTSFEGIQALSYGVKLITTEQPMLKELFGSVATYIDVEQEVIDQITCAPSKTEGEKWLNALAQACSNKPDLALYTAFFKRYSYEACMLRLSLSLKQLLDRAASNNPHIFRACVFSLHRALEQQANTAALKAVEQGINPKA